MNKESYSIVHSKLKFSEVKEKLEHIQEVASTSCDTMIINQIAVLKLEENNLDSIINFSTFSTTKLTTIEKQIEYLSMKSNKLEQVLESNTPKL